MIVCVRKSIHRLSAAVNARAVRSEGECMLITPSSSCTIVSYRVHEEEVKEPYIDKNVAISIFLLEE